MEADPIRDVPDVGGAPDEPRGWAVSAARAADAMTDEDTTVLEVGPVLGIVGYFVITAGRNNRQVKALSEEVEQRVAEVGGPRPVRIEGLDALEWVLMDYGDFVVHVFNVETRRFYDLERLWRDVPRVDWKPEPA